MQWLQTLGFVLGLGALLGGLSAAFWASRSKGIQELLKTENQAYKESNARLAEENKELKQQSATCQAELKVWKNNVTQRPSIDKLISTSTEQHQEYMIKLTDVANGLSSLVTQQSQLTQTIAKALIKEARDAKK